MVTNRKHIKFNWALYEIDKLCKVDKNWEDPANYDNVELIVRNYFEGSDLMFAWNEKAGRGHGILFIGQFNSGKHGDQQGKILSTED